jgi:hypothetical protein
MQVSKRVIQLAKERALFRFSALAVPMTQDADNCLTEALTVAGPAVDQQPLSFARHFLRQEGTYFLKRFGTVYRDYLERAMQTMYSDLRLSLGKVTANQLKLIDDDTVNRQIEVDRLLLRMREADDENLSRLNIMIAQLHGHEDVKERENPFRPYLIALSLHEVLREMVPDEAVAKVLFEHLSNALANHLSEYYAAIRAVFESSGVQAQLLARPSKMVKHQRYSENAAVEFESAEHFNRRVLPGLQRMLSILHGASALGPEGGAGASGNFGTQAGIGPGPGAEAGSAASSDASVGKFDEVVPAERPTDLHEFVKKIFNRGQPTQVPQSDKEASGEGAKESVAPDDLIKPASAELIGKLKQFQKLAARGELASDQNAADQYRISAFGRQMDDSKITGMERITIEVVGALFDFILEDEQIAVSMRSLIARLQIPFLKAAMFEPQLLQQAQHPGRMLLNRMGSASVGLNPETPIGRKIADEMTRIVTKILSEFDDDMTIFGNCLDEFERFLAEQLHNVDGDTAQTAEGIQAAEDVSEILAATTNALRELLGPLRPDNRVSAFVVHTWAHVLCREAGDKEPPYDLRFRKLLPEFIWSVQAKQSPEERTALMRLLPELVTGLKDGLCLVGLPEKERVKRLDPFVSLHMDLLRANQGVERRKMRSLQDLREYFSRFASGEEPAPEATAEASMEIQAAALGMALAERGVSASLDLESDAVPLDTDAEWLAPLQLGNGVERWSGDQYHVARLAWISKRRAFYLFKLETDAKSIIYSSLALIKALREGSVRLVENSAVFERAVDALLTDTEALSPSTQPSPGGAAR